MAVFLLSGPALLAQGTFSFTNIAALKAHYFANKTNFPGSVTGVVILQLQDKSIFLEDASGGLFVGRTNSHPVEPGAIVEVSGLVSIGGFSPILTGSTFRELGRTNLPPPIILSAKEILTSKYDGVLVSVQGRLLESIHFQHFSSLRLLDRGLAFHGELDVPVPPPEWMPWEDGSLLEITGVASIAADGAGQPRSFRLLLRSSGDARQLETAPWWTVDRTLKVVTALGALVLVALVWVASLNFQVRKQTRELEERLEREAALELRYRDLFENAHEFIFTLDPTGQITSANQAAENALGRTRAELVKLNFRDLIPASSKKRYETFLMEAHRNCAVLQEFAVQGKTGEELAVEFSAYCLREEGQPAGLQIIGRDITERKRVERELAELNQSLEKRVEERTAQLELANKELEAFSYSVSHDLRAPLRAIEGFSEILVEDHFEQSNEEGQHLLSGIQKNCRKMTQLIDDLLAFSRVTRSTIEFLPVDMGELFRTTFEDLRQANPDRKIEFNLSPMPKALCDIPMMRQVVVNLLSNAIKYSRKQEAASITVEGKRSGEEIIYSVKDNGVGFDMKYAGKLFGVFHRLHSENEFEGTGVGLAIVQRIIQRHGGRIWVEAAPGKGATFFFTLRPADNLPST